jgi:hypothetical protein
MGEGEPAWWLDADRGWQRGTPPPRGGQQVDDGRWYLPRQRPGEEATAEQEVLVGAPWVDPPALPTEPVAGVAARHLATPANDARGRARVTGHVSETPPWLRILAALAAVIVLFTIGALFAVAHRGHGSSGSPAAAAGGAATSARSGVALSAATPPALPAGGSSSPMSPGSTSTSIPSPTAPPRAGANVSVPPTTLGDPLSACSVGQRRVIEQAKHPSEWYEAHFDPDADGIFCN